MQEDILHIKLLNKSIIGGSKGEHHVDGSRLHNWAKSLIVDFRTLCETLEDPTSLVAIKSPVEEEFVREDPFVGDYVGVIGPRNKLPDPIAY